MNNTLTESLRSPFSEEDRKFLSTIKVFDFSKPIIKPDDIISIDGHTIATPGNVTVLCGPSKGGKSGAMCAMIAGSICTQEIDLGFAPIRIKPNSERKAVIHIDTEQSDYNHYRSMCNVMKRVGMTEKPEYFQSLLLRGHSKSEKIKATNLQIKISAKKHNGVHAIFIDGGADFVNDLNDPREANESVTYLELLAITFNCPVIVVLHLNPGSNDKTRGHYGSQLERKCESQLKITKDKGSGVSTIEGILLRNAGAIPMVHFQYDNEYGYHVTCGHGDQNIKSKNKMNELKLFYKTELEDGLKAVSYTKLVNIIADAESISKSHAKKKIAKMKELKIIIPAGNSAKGLTYNKDLEN